MAAFHLIIYGRFWVITEESTARARQRQAFAPKSSCQPQACLKMKCRVPGCMANSEADKRGAEDKPESSKGYGMDAQDLKQAWDIRTFVDVGRYRG
jgi:hypothetical protein